WCDCLAAAAELARRQGDTDLVAEVVDERKEEGMVLPFSGMPFAVDHSTSTMSPKKLNEVLKRERRVREPTPYPPQDDPFGDDLWDEEEEEEEDYASFNQVLDQLREILEGPARRPKRRKKRSGIPPGPIPNQGSLF
ncbi:MAG: hypothetical protein GY953_05730, partial [bacterium]|nr:hypothetical protein [bacterium]